MLRWRSKLSTGMWSDIARDEGTGERGALSGRDWREKKDGPGSDMVREFTHLLQDKSTRVPPLTFATEQVAEVIQSQVNVYSGFSGDWSDSAVRNSSLLAASILPLSKNYGGLASFAGLAQGTKCARQLRYFISEYRT